MLETSFDTAQWCAIVCKLGQCLDGDTRLLFDMDAEKDLSEATSSNDFSQSILSTRSEEVPLGRCIGPEGLSAPTRTQADAMELHTPHSHSASVTRTAHLPSTVSEEDEVNDSFPMFGMRAPSGDEREKGHTLEWVRGSHPDCIESQRPYPLTYTDIPTTQRAVNVLSSMNASPVCQLQ